MWKKSALLILSFFMIIGMDPSWAEGSPLSKLFWSFGGSEVDEQEASKDDKDKTNDGAKEKREKAKKKCACGYK